MALAPEHAAIGIRRVFTTEGVHPYDLVEWERRDARIIDWRTGAVAFEQLDVEVPATWSVNATNILAQKYFRGALGSPDREWSLKQVVDRIVDTIVGWGERDGYFVDAREAMAFRDELKFLMVTQRMAFNSPVWFNIGVAGVPAQSSACFILAVDDTMDSILNWYAEEGRIFKGGSGAGVNLSNIRGSIEPLGGGGTASGPVSFMRGADASAGTIKSGGKTRRAAKMVILDADHPDVEEFIWCKAVEERKARVLRDAGFDMDLDGKDSFSIQYQNANNSVRLTDDFMQAVLADADWHLVGRLDGNVVKTVKARDLMRQISEAAWECADPGLQFDTTINRWHTAANTGRITASNPCFPGDARVHTDKGLIRFDELFHRANQGETFGIYTHDATNVDAPAKRVEITSPEAFMITGYNEIVKLRFDNGMELRCTPNHRLFTKNRGWVEARGLAADDRVHILDVPAPATMATLALPVDTRACRLPEKWTPEFAYELGRLTVDSTQWPVSIDHAPPEIVDAFVRGLFDAAGSAHEVRSRSGTVLRDLQRLLTTQGVASAVAADGVGAHALRIITAVDVSARLVERVDDGFALTYNLSEPRNHSYVVDGFVVRNCSEYLSLDNSACNLASLNLLQFLHDEGEGLEGFDIEAFKAAVAVTFTAQEILVGNSDYPTEHIGEVTRAFRQLGLGFTNLGALLMALGLPYDSAEGRAVAGSIASLMTGHAYLTSARIASRMGPFAGYLENREPMLRVLNMHREAAAQIDEELVGAELLGAAQCAWDDLCELAPAVGVRNSQATVIAPTGTISFVLDCDTTGIEPDLGLIKTKKLVGGGSMSIVNQTVPRALRRLGYTDGQIDAVVAYIDEHKSVLGAPHLLTEHLPVFATSMGDNVIHYLGHVNMLAAVQPFLSGSASKTVNLPEEATVEEVELLHIEAWKLGLKCVAIYRDNCKVGQPLSVTKKAAVAVVDEVALAQAAHDVVERVVERIVREPVRQKLPRARVSRTFEFRVADCKGFVTIGEYEDGRPGEIFVRVSKQGSTLAGIMDGFAISISHGLQYGVPLRAFVEAFVGMRFEPAGMTDDPDIRIASSLMDYLFRRLAIEYLSPQERAELNILTTGERIQPTLPGVEEAVTLTSAGIDITPDPPSVPSASQLAAQVAFELLPPAPLERPVRAPDAPLCMTCGIQMQRAGSCFVCTECGTTSGCS